MKETKLPQHRGSVNQLWKPDVFVFCEVLLYLALFDIM